MKCTLRDFRDRGQPIAIRYMLQIEQLLIDRILLHVGKDVLYSCLAYIDVGKELHAAGCDVLFKELKNSRNVQGYTRLQSPRELP